eukprot:Platyproteum_vivax@DN4929_c0_g1_i1.p1
MRTVTSTTVKDTIIHAPRKTSVLSAKADEHEDLQFGQTPGVLIIMIGSHFLLYYVAACLQLNSGELILPTTVLKTGNFSTFLYSCIPSYWAVATYLTFIMFQAVIMILIPGVELKGLPLKHEKNKQLVYKINGVWCWYLSLVLLGVLYYTKTFQFSRVVDEFQGLMTTAVIYSNIVSVLTYALAHYFKATHRMTGLLIYDFFMGAWLNPRLPYNLGNFDFKMWAEVRMSWILLFFLTVSAAVKQYETHQSLSAQMVFMLVAHFLYTNACLKGEECIPTTWDIFFEKWGWMLIFWNSAGVPFIYCFQSLFIAVRPFHNPHWGWTTFCFGLLVFSYWVWDTANSQKNRFRMMQRGTYVERHTFPQLPWGTLVNPKTMTTKSGSTLLIDGWWGVARKIHYAADLGMSLSWGLICGFQHALPYLYFVFFITHLVHRANRDSERCQRKYGSDWKAYCEKVPYVLIPGIY